MSSFLYMIGLFVGPRTQRDRNVVRRLSSRLWGEALRDDTNDGCGKDKPTTSLFLISVFMMLKKRQINYLKVGAKRCCRENFGWVVVVFKKS